MESLWQSIDFEAVRAKIVSYFPNILGVLILLIFFWVLTVFSRKALSAGFHKWGIASGMRMLMVRFTKAVIVTIAILTIAAQLGINVTALVAGLGIAGLALSFAAQNTIENIISGIVLIIDRPLREGDWVSIDNLHGVVTEIRLRTTVFTTFDNETVVIPNKALAQERVVNYTLTPKIRIRVPIGIAYKEDTEAAREVLLNTIEGDDRILEDPAPIVWVMDIGPNSVNLQLRFWTEDSLQKFPLQWEYTEKCKRALDKAGIQIPLPHLQLLLEQSEGLNALIEKRREV